MSPANIDIDQQITYWRTSSQEDSEAARSLLDQKHVRHALFFLHLSLEKILKAHVCRFTRDLAPRTHNLIVLAERGGVTLSAQAKLLLAGMDELNLAGRYPGTEGRVPSEDEA